MTLSINSKGAALMALAMAAFTCNDALVKALSAHLNIGQIMFLRGLLSTVLVFLIARQMGALRPLRVMMHPMVLLRTLLEIGATVSFLSALPHMPLANISAILQAMPLAVTLGAAVFLSEPVGWRRWSAIIVGFVGVMIIVRPGPEGFTSAALLAILSMLCAAARDLVTKRIPTEIPSLAITVFTALTNSMAGIALLGPLGGWKPLDLSLIAMLIGAGSLVFVGYQSIVLAMRMGEISFVAPFRYASLLWALVLGYLMFGEEPDAFVLTGAAIVIGSGLYSFYRERKRRLRTAAATQPAPGSSA